MAQAAPGIPQPKTMMKSGSITMFVLREKASTMVGAVLLPSVRTIFVVIMSAKVTGNPQKQMRMKEYAPSMISGGVCIQTSSCQTMAELNTVSTAAVRTLITRQAAALCRTPCMSCAPKRCPV